MAEIKLTRRVKYAGDIVNGLIDAGWDFERAIQFVHNLPDAKPERPNGRWVDVTPPGAITCGGNPVYGCSECGYVYGSFELFPTAKFCRECGADMRGENE